MTVSISLSANWVQAERTDRQGNQASHLAFSPVSPRLAIVSFARASIVEYCQQSKGLFTWARFPRSRLNSKSFVKFLMCSCERAGWLLQKHDLCFPSYHTGSITSHTSAENNWANRCVCYSIQPTIKPVRVTEKAFLEPKEWYLPLSFASSIAFSRSFCCLRQTPKKKETWFKVETVNKKGSKFQFIVI